MPYKVPIDIDTMRTYGEVDRTFKPSHILALCSDAEALARRKHKR
jgi:hypothetical protein